MFLFLIIPPQWESMPAIWTVHKKLMKFGTLIGVVLNTNLTKLRVSDTNSIVPTPFQIVTFILIITFQPFTLETQFLFTFCLRYYSSTVSHNQCLTLCQCLTMTPPITVFTILKLNIYFFTTLPNLYNFYRNWLKWLLVVFPNNIFKLFHLSVQIL